MNMHEKKRKAWKSGTRFDYARDSTFITFGVVVLVLELD